MHALQTMEALPADNQDIKLWLTDAEASALWGNIPLRTARHRLKDCLRRTIPTKGRPRSQYYVGNIPDLVAALSLPAMLVLPVEQKADDDEHTQKFTEVDLTTGRLRLQAVKSYLHLKEVMTEEQAAGMTVSEWATHPREETVTVTERIGRDRRRHTQHISVGGFSQTTLREWARAALDAADGGAPGQIRALAPKLRGNVGRQAAAIPSQLLDLVHALAVANPRADLVKALAKARQTWVGKWPDVSYRTWLRRMEARDPERFCKTLGKHGIAEFNRRHSPDIERDYSTLSFNEEWQLDDAREDFYVHGNDPRQILRPYAYKIIRVATRQWICAVTSETPITQAQVRALIGNALASKSGGIPNRIRFERGTIACTPYLESLLNDLGIKVSRTSMDGGRVAAGAIEDKASGHFQGKAVVEANIRRSHNAAAYAPGQIGASEEGGSARQQTLKAYARAMAARNQIAILPTPAEWHRFCGEVLERCNNAPLTSFPEFVTPEGEVRHMSPNEYAVQLGQQAIQVMDEALLPLFYSKGQTVEVTKNGIRINNETFGRFDPDLADLAGTQVTVYATEDFPDGAFVVELGRFVPRYEKSDFAEDTAQYQAKMRRNTIKRSQYEAMISRALESAGAEIAEIIRFTGNPTPERAFSVVCPQALRDRQSQIQAAGERMKNEARKSAARFNIDEEPAPARDDKPRRGMLADAAEIRDQFQGGRLERLDHAMTEE